MNKKKILWLVFSICPISLLVTQSTSDPMLTIGEIALLLFAFGNYLCDGNAKEDVMQQNK